MRQEAPTKPCVCGRGKIYTSPIDAKRNHKVKVEGRELIRCVECALDEIYAKSLRVVKDRNEEKRQ